MFSIAWDFRTEWTVILYSLFSFWFRNTEPPDPQQEIHSVDETLRQICKMNVKMTGLIPKLNELDTEAGKENLDSS